MTSPLTETDLARLRERLDAIAEELGFDQVGVAGIELPEDEANLERWLGESRHGGMEYMARHGRRRSRPAELVPGTLRVISVRMAALPPDARPAEDVLADGSKAFIARYALGRDYHRSLGKASARVRAGLARLGVPPAQMKIGPDAVPVLERALAARAGIGFLAKSAGVISPHLGPYLLLSEVVTPLELPFDAASTGS